MGDAYSPPKKGREFLGFDKAKSFFFSEEERQFPSFLMFGSGARRDRLKLKGKTRKLDFFYQSDGGKSSHVDGATKSSEDLLEIRSTKMVSGHSREDERRSETEETTRRGNLRARGPRVRYVEGDDDYLFNEALLEYNVEISGFKTKGLKGPRKKKEALDCDILPNFEIDRFQKAKEDEPPSVLPSKLSSCESSSVAQDRTLPNQTRVVFGEQNAHQKSEHTSSEPNSEHKNSICSPEGRRFEVDPTTVETWKFPEESLFTVGDPRGRYKGILNWKEEPLFLEISTSQFYFAAVSMHTQSLGEEFTVVRSAKEGVLLMTETSFFLRGCSMSHSVLATSSFDSECYFDTIVSHSHGPDFFSLRHRSSGLWLSCLRHARQDQSRGLTLTSTAGAGANVFQLISH